MEYFAHFASWGTSSSTLELRAEHGAEGYGIYLLLLEHLCQCPRFTSHRDYTFIARRLMVKTRILREVVENYGLFRVTEDSFTSPQFDCYLSANADKKLHTWKERYFPHKLRMLNDVRIHSLFKKRKATGYGAYWMILERLCMESDYNYKGNMAHLAYELHLSKDLFEDIVENHNLFITEGNGLYSPDLAEWMRPMTSSRKVKAEKKSVPAHVSAARKAAALKRWAKGETTPEISQNAVQKAVILHSPDARPDANDAKFCIQKMQNECKTDANLHTFHAKIDTTHAKPNAKDANTPAKSDANLHVIKNKKEINKNNLPPSISPPAREEEGDKFSNSSKEVSEDVLRSFLSTLQEAYPGESEHYFHETMRLTCHLSPGSYGYPYVQAWLEKPEKSPYYILIQTLQAFEREGKIHAFPNKPYHALVKVKGWFPLREAQEIKNVCMNDSQKMDILLSAIRDIEKGGINSPVQFIRSRILTSQSQRP